MSPTILGIASALLTPHRSTASPPSAVLPSTTTGGTTSSSASTAAANNSPDLFTYLIAEMQNQDPASPTSSSDMANQLASLQVAQGSQKMTAELGSVLQMQALATTSSLLGHTVAINDPGNGTITGKIGSVTVQGSTVLVNVNGTNYPSTEIQQLTQ